MEFECADKTVAEFLQCENHQCQSFKELVDSINEAIHIWELKNDNTVGKCLEANLSAEKLLGIERAEMLNRSLAELYPSNELHKLPDITKQLLHREELTFKIDRLPKEGKFISVEVNAKIIKTKNQRVVISVTRDLTKSKRVTEKLWEANRTYRFLFDHNPLPIIIFDLETRNILEVNDAAVDFYGYGKHEFKGLTIFDIRPEDEIPRVNKYLSRLKDTADNEGKWQHQKKNGEICNVEIIAQNIQYKGTAARYLIIQDISEKEKEESLIRQQIALVNNNPAPVIQTDSEFRITLVNYKAEQIFKHELVGEYLFKLLPPINEINLFNLFNRENNQFKYKLGDRHFVFTVNWEPELSSFYVFGSDITILKQVDEALKLEKAFFEELFQNAPEGIVIVDNESYVMRVNKKFTELFGYGEEEIMGINVDDLIADEIDREEAFGLTKKASVGDQFMVESYRKTKEGEKIPVSITGAPIIVGGAQRAVLGIYRDISERQQFMDALRFEKDLFHNLMENIPDAIYFKDLDSRFIRVNKNCTEKFRLKNPEEAIGKSDADFFSKESAETYLTGEQEIIKTGVPIVNEEIVESLLDGETKWASITKMPFKNSDNEIIGTCGISRDITLKKEYEKMLEEYAAELAKSNDSKDKLLSIIAHDLKNPFNAIINLSRLLEDYYDDYTKNEHLSIISQIISASEKTYGLLSNLLDWARSQQGLIVVNKQKTDLKELTQIATAPFEEFAKFKGIKLVNKCGERFVNADRYMLQTVISNLVNNAIKYTETGGEIIIDSAATDESVELSLTDNGIGMEQATIEKLFKFEETVSKVGTNNEKGTGLGLILCNEFIEKNDGEIIIESEPGRGTTFILRFPNPD